LNKPISSKNTAEIHMPFTRSRQNMDMTALAHNAKANKGAAIICEKPMIVNRNAESIVQSELLALTNRASVNRPFFGPLAA
jgi:hypothetical protein